MEFYYQNRAREWILVFTLVGGMWLCTAKTPALSVDENVSTLEHSGKLLPLSPIISDTLPQADSIQTVYAKFNGKADNFRILFSKLFDFSSVDENSGFLYTIVSLDIDVDGSVDNIKAEGNNIAFNRSAVRTAKQVLKRGTWTPEIQNGVPVKSTYRFPLQMRVTSTNGSGTQNHRW